MIRHECILFTLSFQLGEGRTQRKSRGEMGEYECKKKGHFSESSAASRAEVNPFPSPGSLVCGGLPLSKPSTHPASPLPTPPEARASHQSTWPPPRLLVCVSASDCTKTSGPGGRDTSEAGQDVEGSRGERGDEGERQPQHHVHEEEK